MNSKLARLVGWWLSICSKRPWTILLICAALLAATIPVTLGLRIDTDLAKLLPEDLPESVSPSERASRTLHELFRPLLFSWLTTSAGYAGLVISHHPGLKSIGVLALIGLTCCFLMSVTLLPLLLSAEIGNRGRSRPLFHANGFTGRAPGAAPHRAARSFSTANGTLFSSDMICLR